MIAAYWSPKLRGNSILKRLCRFEKDDDNLKKSHFTAFFHKKSGIYRLF